MNGHVKICRSSTTITFLLLVLGSANGARALVTAVLLMDEGSLKSSVRAVQLIVSQYERFRHKLVYDTEKVK